jgi:DNA repair protein RadB
MKVEKISAGSYDLNKFLHGGYEKDIITTIYGPGGSGKTNFCLLVAVSQAKRGSRVIYVDTEGGFSPERVEQILKKSPELVDKTLQNILILNPTSFEEQEKAFAQLLKHVSFESVDLIIIDSMVMLYRLELGDAVQSGDDEKIKQVNRNLAGQLRKLNEIARKEKIPVVVTNQVYSSFVKEEDELKEKQVSMVGGDLLKYWSKCLIELKSNYGKRKIILRKHRSLPQKELSFEIVDEGIKKKGMW